MLHQLKINSAKKSTASKLGKHQSKAVNKIDALGIIISEEVAGELNLESLKNEFSRLSKNICIIVFSEKKQENLLQLKKKDLGWKGEWKNDSEAEDFVLKRYDVLINYFNKPKPELIILSASASAKIKVGFPKIDKRLNDLEINVQPTAVKAFVSELKKYLAIINQ